MASSKLVVHRSKKRSEKKRDRRRRGIEKRRERGKEEAEGGARGRAHWRWSLSSKRTGGQRERGDRDLETGEEGEN